MNLRWILLFAGLAILLLLYFSGRPKKQGTGRSAKDRERDDALGLDNDDQIDIGPGLQDNAFGGAQGDSHLDPTQSHLASDPLMVDAGGTPRQGQIGGNAFEDGFSPSDAFGQVDPADLVRPGGNATDYRPPSDTPPPPPVQKPVMLDAGKTGSGRSISEKIEAFSAKLSPKRKSRVASSVPPESAGTEKIEDKVILLHVIAMGGHMIDGPQLLELFEQRGYHYGERQVFHSLHQGQPVFSIAKIVEPGSFDIDDMSSFVTPGLVMILQLPGPVPGDVAFEVMVSEAQELAQALGCQVLDSERSTLSKQTVQHLRESIYEYMHRQKYFAKVPS